MSQITLSTKGNRQVQKLPRESQLASPKWIAGRIQTLLSHYYQPDTPEDVKVAALSDWVFEMGGYTQDQIDGACRHYIRSQPSKRPSPADIIARIDGMARDTGNGIDRKANLSRDKQDMLYNQILPTARRWLQIPGLKEHGERTLKYWGES